MKVEDQAALVVALYDTQNAAKRAYELARDEFIRMMNKRPPAERFVMVGNRKVAVESSEPREFDVEALFQSLATEVFDAIAPRKVLAGEFDKAASRGLIPAAVIDTAVSRKDPQFKVAVH
jgi:hypothetical protein